MLSSVYFGEDDALVLVDLDQGKLQIVMMWEPLSGTL